MIMFKKTKFFKRLTVTLAILLGFGFIIENGSITYADNSSLISVDNDSAGIDSGILNTDDYKNYTKYVNSLLEKYADISYYHGTQKKKNVGKRNQYKNGAMPTYVSVKKLTIYNDMGNNTTLSSALKSAVKSWNSTKACHFSIIKKKKKADIIVHLWPSKYADYIDWVGLTMPTYNYYDWHTIYTSVTLNWSYINSGDWKNEYPSMSTKSFAIHALEHELGHTLGLDDTYAGKSVMYGSSDKIYGIQKKDIEAVKKIYKNRK